ncbi:Hsp20/alpha crystallin family protein [Candidatus Peregrinibacteria bacterium]|jgi:HSP20 family protein|nr:Hsp20/alpha crystallin family protein [Candidatus Peregrinibacteria bacterium]
MEDTTTTLKSVATNTSKISKIKRNLNEKIESTEGQLSVDIYQDELQLIILAPISGCLPEDIELTITDDVLSIKGKREIHPDIDQDDYFTKECFWGVFSRAVVLPTKTDASKITAKFEKGILRIEIPKADMERTRKIDIVEIL